MKVLLTTSSREFGGGEEYLSALANFLAKEKVEITLLAKKSLLKLSRFSKYLSENVATKEFKLVQFLRELMSKEYDLAHFNLNDPVQDKYYWLTTKLLGAPTVVTIHSLSPEITVNWWHKIQFRITTWLLSKVAKKIIVVSESAKKIAVDVWKIDERKLVVIKNGVNIDKFKLNRNKRKKIRKRLGVKSEQILIGHAGRFDLRSKRQDWLLRRFKRLVGKYQNLRLLLVGQGHDEKIIKKIIRDLKFKKGEVSVLQNIEDMVAIYSAMDIFVFPSAYESGPLALMEAMSCKLPAVISQIDSLREVVSYQVSLKKLIEDQNLRRKLGIRSRELIKKKFKQERMLTDTKNLYQSLIKA